MNYYSRLNVGVMVPFCRGSPPMLIDCRSAVLPDSPPQVSAGVCSPGHRRGNLSLQRSDCLRQSGGFLCSECWCLRSVSAGRDAQLPEGTRRTKQLCDSWDDGERSFFTITFFHALLKKHSNKLRLSVIYYLAFGTPNIMTYQISVFQCKTCMCPNLDCHSSPIRQTESNPWITAVLLKTRTHMRYFTLPYFISWNCH